MRKVSIGECAIALYVLSSAEWSIRCRTRQSKIGDGTEQAHIGKALDWILEWCDENGFPETASHVRRQQAELQDKDIAQHLPTLASVCKTTYDGLIVELATTQSFFAVKKEDAVYLATATIFNEHVLHRFPSAQADFADACRCIAYELPTAAVFHLMRVAEVGLRALAYDRRLASRKPNQPAFENWGKIIKDLEDAEKSIQQYPKSAARDAQFEFYHGVMMDFRAFKNTFRNPVSHSARSFSLIEAKRTFEHVKSFMFTLATKLSEGRRTPQVWKGSKWLSNGVPQDQKLKGT